MSRFDLVKNVAERDADTIRACSINFALQNLQARMIFLLGFAHDIPH